MFTAAALRSLPDCHAYGADMVTTAARLRMHGWSDAAIRAQLDARRWQRIGRAIILHNGPLTEDELRRAALIVLGPRAVLASFTALAGAGLTNWERDDIHLLVPRGARVRRPAGLPLVIHYTDRWDLVLRDRRADRQAPAAAALLAATSFRSVRPACAVLAATVQQRLARPMDLLAALDERPRLRHRRMLVAAAHDIAGGAQALSEIDFVRLCRRNGLPEPDRQVVRTGPDGRRRYLDAEWTRQRDGCRVVAEVDGALHLMVQNWWDDQLRQNDVAIDVDVFLRYPSVVLRAEEQLVARQLRRALR